MTTKAASILIGIVFIAVGLLGFVSNPIIGETDTTIFHADTTHNAVHIVSGVLFLIIGFAAPGSAATFLKIFGIVYFFLGVLGMMNIGDDGMTQLLGFLHVNGADNYLHIGLGIIIFLAGLLPRVRPVTVDR